MLILYLAIILLLNNTISSDNLLKIEKNGSNLWAWGDNNRGQLGTNDSSSSNVPVKVNIEGVIKISAGDINSLALKADGTVWAWGDNYFGQLGNGKNEKSFVPVKVLNLDEVVKISAGFQFSLAIREEGTVWGWGRNDEGQLGIGNNSHTNLPAKVPEINDAIEIDAGGWHTLLIRKDKTVWAWGRNISGQLGNGTKTSSNVPIKVQGLEGAVAIAAGDDYSLALKEDGTVWAWGSNKHGQLGNGTNVDSLIPIKVPNLENIISIKAGAHHSLALKQDGTVWAWGWNGSGQLGNGNFSNSNLPVQVMNLTKINYIEAGYAHSFAIGEDGSLWAWGRNWSGQLGIGDNVSKSIPFNVSSLSEVKEVAGGGEHSLALGSEAGGCTNYRVSPEKQYISFLGAMHYFTVLADEGCPWICESNKNWIKIKTSGNGTSLLSYFVDENQNFSRQGEIEIKSISGIKKAALTVVQESKAYFSSRIFIPAVARTKGGHGTNWKSDVMILNQRHNANSYRISFVPAGSSWMEKINCQSFSINPMEAILYEDVLLNACGIEENASGNLVIEADNPLIASSRLYNDQPNGTYGQYIMSKNYMEGFFDEKSYILGLRNDENFRTNIGLVDLWGIGGEVNIKAYNANGELFGEAKMHTKQFGWNQISWDGLGFGQTENAYITIDVISGGYFFAYASVIDNKTGDAIFIPAISHSFSEKEKKLLPISVHAIGSYGTNWRTDVWILNLDDSDKTITFKYYTSFNTYEKELKVPEKNQMILKDIIGEGFFEIEENSSGSLHVLNAEKILVISRIYNQTENGTYGQYVPSKEETGVINPESFGYLLPLICNSDFRTNIGFTNFDSDNSHMRFTLYDEKGNELSFKDFNIEAYKNVQINDIFGYLNLNCNYNSAYAKVEVISGGRIYAYASVIDNRTGDAIFIYAR